MSRPGSHARPCPARGCTQTAARRRLLCSEHWAHVPPNVKEYVRAALRNHGPHDERTVLAVALALRHVDAATRPSQPRQAA